MREEGSARGFAAVALAIGLISLAVAYGFSPPTPVASCFFDDHVTYFEPMDTYSREVLAQGRLPLWNPYQSCGQPFLAMMQASPLYPGNWLPISWSVTGFKLNTLLHVALSLGGMVLWLRGLGLHGAAAAAGAIVYGTSNTLLHFTCDPDFHNALCWLPMLFWSVDRVLRNPEPRGAAVLALIGAATILTGSMQFIIYDGYAIGAYAGFCLAVKLVRGKEDTFRLIWYLAVAAICGSALAAVQLLPSIETARLGQRPLGGLSVAEILAFGPLGLARTAHALVDPGQLGYIGTALILVLSAALSDRALGTRLLFALLAVFFWAVSTGTGPLFQAFVHIPTGDWFRIPARLLVITVFACATLAGFGVQALIDRAAWRGRHLLTVGVSSVTVCCLLDPARRWYAVALGAMLLGTILSGRSARRRVRNSVAYLIPFVLLVEAFATTPNRLAPFDLIPAMGGKHHDLIAFLQRHQGWDRVHIAHSVDRTLPAKTAMRYHLYSDYDWELLMTRRLAEYWAYMTWGDPPGQGVPREPRLTADAPNIRLLDYLSTRFIVEAPFTPFLASSDRPMTSKFRSVFQSKSGNWITENQGSLARVLVVGRTELSLPGVPLLSRLADPTFPAEGMALVENAQDVIDAPSGAAGEATLVGYGDERADITVRATRPGMVIFNDAFYPGWQATVDGRPTRIAPVNYLFRGVRVDAGTHKVRFEYRPLSVYVGTVISALGLLGIVTLRYWGRRDQSDRDAVAARARRSESPEPNLQIT